MLSSQQRLSGASCVSFVWLINEHSSAVWAAEKMECLRFYSYVTILSLLPQHPPSKADELWLLPGLEWKLVRSTAEIKMYSPELWKTHASHTVCRFFFPFVCVCVYLKDICLTSSALQQPELGRKLPFARPTTNIIISNLLCCARANRTDTT